MKSKIQYKSTYLQKKDRLIKNRFLFAKGGAWREGVGVWNQQRQTIIYRMDKQQDPLYSTGNYTQYPQTNHKGKEYEKHLCIIESLCNTEEINTTL